VEARGTARLDEAVRRGRTPGLQYVAVDASTTRFAHHSGLADVAAGRPLRADTTMMAYSMSKTITAAAVLQLVESGAMGLDDAVARHLEWQPYGPEITIRQLLAHTSGAPSPIPLRWVHPAADHATFDEKGALIQVLRRHPRLAFAPGSRFAYSNIGYWLLGAIVERTTGRPFTSYVAAEVLGRLAVDSRELAYAVLDPARHAAGYLEKYSWFNLVKGWLIDRALIGDYAGAWLRIRDHYVNGPAFGGLVGSARGFAAFLQDLLSERPRLLGERARAWLAEAQRISGGPIPMTLGWHIGENGAGRYFFKEGGGGGFHCLMRLYPAQRIGTVVMTNATGAGVTALLDAVDPLVF